MKRMMAIAMMTASLAFSQVMVSNNQVYGETPSGTLDGVNVTFTLHFQPATANGIALFRNGMRQKLGGDYTVSGSTITFTASAPQAGDLLLADYVTGNATLLNTNNLSDLANVTIARTNLGLGSAALQSAISFDAAGAASAAVSAIPNASSSTTGHLTSADWSRFNAKQAPLGYTPLNPTNNLSDVSSPATARVNLGLGSASTQPTAAFEAAGTAAAMLVSPNNWTGANTFTAPDGPRSTILTLAQTNQSTLYVQGQWGGYDLGGPNGTLIYNSRGSIGFRAGAISGNAQLLLPSSGRVLIGSPSDNGIDQLQVTGSVNATGYRAGGVAGVSGTITIPKLTSSGSYGTITVTNGLITGFTNPN